MKPKIIILMFSGLLAGSIAVSGQNNPAADTAAATNATPSTGATVDAAATAAPTAAASVEAQPAPETTHAVVTNSPIIPLIVMDEVPLTDAVKNLARQANINYMLDPRIAFGQPGPDGKIIPQPSVSIRWENITAEQALNALLANYGLQLVEDPKTRIARVTVKDPAAPDPLLTKIIQLGFASPTNILAAAQTVLTDKRSKIMGDIRTSQLVVLATEREIAAIDQMVERLDLPTRQVLIEARMLETSLNPSTAKGIDWSGTLQNQNLAFGNNLQNKPVQAGESDNKPLASNWPKMLFDTAKGFNPATAFLDADGVNAVLHFINQNSEAKVISSPRTVTLDNETATLSVTRASPIINVTAGTANTTGGSSISYTNLGVILLVTPRISANDYVNLHVIPEVSRIFGTVRKTVSGLPTEADEYDVRRIETRVMVPSGNTLVLGGLVQDDTRIGNTKVPVLGDIPFLGGAFRSDSKSRQKNNLLIFITPTIVKDSDFRPTKTDFLKSTMEDTAEKEWGPWDSGKPYDWSRITHHDYKF
jgi:Bacterial type II and III secretion system protein